ncbi:MAG: hypothetical protein KME31_15105 [Tolypothrix carrinoi HA7290-LM1]|jgi:hypothetical protein|nr:hypothetical protein [Tolypothrix carrinoi HA7290-LM1]
MSQPSFKDKALERYDLQKSKLLTPFGHQARMKNFGANSQPEYSCQRKTMLLASTSEFTTRMCKRLGYLPERARYWIAVGCSILFTCGTFKSAIARPYLIINITERAIKARRDRVLAST